MYPKLSVASSSPSPGKQRLPKTAYKPLLATKGKKTTLRPPLLFLFPALHCSSSMSLKNRSSQWKKYERRIQTHLDSEEDKPQMASHTEIGQNCTKMYATKCDPFRLRRTVRRCELLLQLHDENNEKKKLHSTIAGRGNSDNRHRDRHLDELSSAAIVAIHQWAFHIYHFPRPHTSRPSNLEMRESTECAVLESMNCQHDLSVSNGRSPWRRSTFPVSQTFSEILTSPDLHNWMFHCVVITLLLWYRTMTNSTFGLSKLNKKFGSHGYSHMFQPNSYVSQLRFSSKKRIIVYGTSLFVWCCLCCFEFFYGFLLSFMGIVLLCINARFGQELPSGCKSCMSCRVSQELTWVGLQWGFSWCVP